MLKHRLLVIGSQCTKLPPLTFLPSIAELLRDVMTEPGLGGCTGVPVRPRTPGLLLDPTVAEAKRAIQTAIDEAAKSRETLILAYIGHGEFFEPSNDFYLMPTDATELTSDGAIHLAEFVKDRIKFLQDRSGLVVLLDACHAGAGAWQAMERWAQSLGGNFGFELLTATDDRKTANAPLARAIIEIIKHGDPEADEQIHCRDVHRRLIEQNYSSQHIAYNSNDERLYLARNLARDPGDAFWRDCFGRAQILKQTEYFQPMPQLAEVAQASQAHAVVLLTGEPGAGKSTLAAALARPELTDGLVPSGFVHAIIVLGLMINQRRLADDLVRQLRRAVPQFAEAAGNFEQITPLDERESLDFLRRKVLRPLAQLPNNPVVRIVLDGFNELSDAMRRSVAEALSERSGNVRLVITTRADTPECPEGRVILYGRAGRDVLESYLGARRVPERMRTTVLDKARDHWLVARLLADAALANPEIDLTRLPSTVDDAYATLLDQSGVADAWHERLSAIFGILAVSGFGPVLPLPLLVFASDLSGGPSSLEGVRDVLVSLRGLVTRQDAGTQGERAGLFHPTLADYLLGQAAAAAGYAVNPNKARRAIIDAIEALAPLSQHDVNDPLHRYALRYEPDVRWQLGDFTLAVECLEKRLSNLPLENLERWQQWYPTILAQFGPSHRVTLRASSNIARWTGEAGDAREALRLFTDLLPEQERLLGPDDLDTLRTRNNLAAAAGDAGNPREALWLLTELLADQQRVQGRDHPDTLATRNSIARWTGEVSGASEALRLISELLPDQERVLGRYHVSTLRTRHDKAAWTEGAGNAREALRLFTELLPDQERVLGHYHPNTLRTRHNIAEAIKNAGNADEARRLLTKLLPDQELVLGRDHPDTLMTLYNIAISTGDIGDRPAAARLLAELVPRQERALGRDHPNTLNTLLQLAIALVENGDRLEGCRLLHEGHARASARFGTYNLLTQDFVNLIRTHCSSVR
jgi:tetratricopeptide (TPR) repeat protein